MNDNIVAAANASLHGELAGMLRSAWRRSAELTRLQEAGAGDPVRAATPFLAVLAATVGAVLIVAGTVAVTGAASAASSTAAPGAPPAFDALDPDVSRRAAVQAFRTQRYATAYGRFAQLADDGDGCAALMALAMVNHGRVLFGSDWSATPGQLRRWSAAALQHADAHALAIVEHDRGE